jgi:hypothetical protein
LSRNAATTPSEVEATSGRRAPADRETLDGVFDLPFRVAEWRQPDRLIAQCNSAATLACDFLTVDTVWLRRLDVFFVISIGRRRLEYLACAGKPDTAWMMQQARNLLMTLHDRGQRPRF